MDNLEDIIIKNASVAFSFQGQRGKECKIYSTLNN